MESRYVRLESGSGKPKKKAAGAVEHTLKLAIRLNEAINDALRGLIRYRGDLSGMAIDALSSVDLENAGLISVEEKMVRDTTITIPRALHKRLKKISADRATSMGILVNTALAHWLAQKGALAPLKGVMNAPRPQRWDLVIAAFASVIAAAGLPFSVSLGNTASVGLGFLRPEAQKLYGSTCRSVLCPRRNQG